MPRIGRGTAIPPGTTPEPYVLAAPFEDNQLTTDRDMYDMMRAQVTEHEGLALGGPSFVWLREALAECAELDALPSPALPCLTCLGTNERIVRIDRVHDRMARWPGGRLELIEGAEHEVLMETPGTRARIFDDLAAHFAAAV